jgi:NADP-dependent 3-hydroxy acid dehydrogenase YdfG
MLISQGNFNRNMLLHQIAIVTGAGRGIGFEAAKAWFGLVLKS